MRKLERKNTQVYYIQSKCSLTLLSQWVCGGGLVYCKCSERVKSSLPLSCLLPWAGFFSSQQCLHVKLFTVLYQTFTGSLHVWICLSLNQTICTDRLLLWLAMAWTLPNLAILSVAFLMEGYKRSLGGLNGVVPLPTQPCDPNAHPCLMPPSSLAPRHYGGQRGHT